MDAQVGVTESDLLQAIQDALSQRQAEGESDDYLTTREITDRTGKNIRVIRRAIRQLLESGQAELGNVLRYTPMLDRKVQVPGYRMKVIKDD